jgi:hypothetical protein
MKMHGNLIDLVGRAFSHLTVIKRSEVQHSSHVRWVCLCSCGNCVIVQGNHLREGRAKSCGCWRSERLLKHGHARIGKATPTYRSWYSMISRCSNSHNNQWSNYGKRGITVCKRWGVFQNFLDDMGKKPTKLTLERVDNEKGYQPGNCRWATQEEQQHNTRRNHNITIGGETRCLAEWRRLYSLNSPTVRKRMNRGWSPSMWFSPPVPSKGRITCA